MNNMLLKNNFWPSVLYASKVFLLGIKRQHLA